MHITKPSVLENSSPIKVLVDTCSNIVVGTCSNAFDEVVALKAKKGKTDKDH